MVSLKKLIYLIRESKPGEKVLVRDGELFLEVKTREARYTLQGMAPSWAFHCLDDTYYHHRMIGLPNG